MATNNITFPIYNAGGKPSLGLKRRRVAEANMFLGRDEYRIDAQGNINKK